MSSQTASGLFEVLCARVRAVSGRLPLALRIACVALISLAAIGAIYAAMTLLAVPAYAAPGGAGSSGGGDAIHSTLANVRNYIAGILLLLGGIGFVVSLGLKAASPINENAQYLSHMGLKASAIAVLAGAIVNPIMSIIQGLAG